MPSSIKSAAAKRSIINSKWIKTKFLLQHPVLRKYIPETVRYSSENLNDMLDKYGMVYIKPNKGSCGNGVIKVIKYSRNKYGYHIGEAPRSFSSYKDMYQSLCKKKYNRDYLIQKGIDLLTYQKRIFDIRVMMQKNPEYKWECSGYIGRLAHPKKVVTNFHNSGKPMTVEALLEPHMQGERKKAYIRSLIKIGDQIASEFQKSYPGMKELGVDIGIDASMKPWIIEVNSYPDAYIFNQLKNKTMFRRVLFLKKWNGRLKTKKSSKK